MVRDSVTEFPGRESDSVSKNAGRQRQPVSMANEGVSDRELVRCARTGDEVAYGQLVERLPSTATRNAIAVQAERLRDAIVVGIHSLLPPIHGDLSATRRARDPFEIPAAVLEANNIRDFFSDLLCEGQELREYPARFDPSFVPWHEARVGRDEHDPTVRHASPPGER